MTYIVYPLMDQPGLKCTAAISKQVSSGPIEIQINFFGTIDFASLLADMERAGPGQQTLKIHEAKLLQQVNSLIESMSAIYPNKTFRLRLAGHSLGGALAKGFAHSMQRACALQKNTPETIVMKIKKELEKKTSIENTVPEGELRSLQEKLNVDKDKFRELNALSKVEGMTIYALGAPGLSKTTDRHASLFTYYHPAYFLNVYNHYHREDIIPKFGDTEFFSGKNGVIPRVIVNKAVQYDAKLSEGEVKEATPLPFPGITKRVMAAHNKRIYTGDRSVQSTVVELTESKHVLEKFSFSVFRRALYEIIFFLAKILALFMSKTKWIYTLESYPARDIEAPKNIINLSAR